MCFLRDDQLRGSRGSLEGWGMRTVLPSEAVLSKPESSNSLTSEGRGAEGQ